MALSLMSSAFSAGKPIPPRYTCDGTDLSPPLQWSGVPANTRSLALIVSDPDAPDPAAPQRTWVHWVLYDLPASTRLLPEGVTQRELPRGTLEGLNDFHRAEWGGPCPPVGRHRYFFNLYALDVVLPELKNATVGDLDQAMQGHILEQAELLGTYERKQR